MSDSIDLPKGNFLTGKLGPLPVWAWGAILGGGALVFYLIRNKASGSTTAPTATDGSALDTIGYATSGLGNGVTPANGAPTSQSGSPTDNQSWLNTATTGVANQLTAPPIQVQLALSKYLDGGGTLNATEQKYVNTAINLYGAPPSGTGGASNLAGTTTAPATYGKDGSGVYVSGASLYLAGGLVDAAFQAILHRAPTQAERDRLTGQAFVDSGGSGDPGISGGHSLSWLNAQIQAIGK